jgi:hypothetical protein
LHSPKDIDIRANAVKFLCRATMAVTLSLLAGCGATVVTIDARLPQPLTVKQQLGIGWHVPAEFSQYTYREKRYGSDWRVNLGAAQTRALTQMLEAMFESVVPLNDVTAAHGDRRVRAVVEPAVDEYSFITPRDAGSPVYAVSIKYRLTIYTAAGKLADSWAFTGYGSVPAQGGFDSDEPLKMASELALRDAGAKLVAEFRDQAALKELIEAHDETAPAEAAAPQPAEAIKQE